MATQRKDLKLDSFVGQVRPDPNSNEQVTLLQGYLGNSNVPGHVRVYFDEELNNFVEVPEADILYCAPNDKSENPLGGSRLWVKNSTVVTMGDPKSANRQKSTFLEGDVLSAYGDMGLEADQFQQIPQTLRCNIIGPVTNTPGCFSVGNTACITNNAPCPSIGIACHVSKFVICKTKFGIPCHVVTIAKPTCFKTCQVSCAATCLKPSCIQTCLQPTCFKTQCQVSCFRSCVAWQSCGFACTIQTPCQVFECANGSVTFADPRTPVINPTVEFNPGFAAQQQGFQGTFDPFQTGF